MTTPNATRTSTLSQRFAAIDAELDTALGGMTTTTNGVSDADAKDIEAAAQLADDEAQRGNEEYRQLLTLVDKTNALLANADLTDAAQVAAIRAGLDGIYDYFDPADGMIELPLDAERRDSRHLAALRAMVGTLLKHKLPGDTLNKKPHGTFSYEGVASWLKTVTGIRVADESATLQPRLHTASGMREKLSGIHTQLGVRQKLGERRRMVASILGTALSAYAFGRYSVGPTIVEKNPVSQSVAPDEEKKIEGYFAEFAADQIDGRKIKITFPKGLKEGSDVMLQAAVGPGKPFETIDVGSDGTIDIPRSAPARSRIYFSLWIRTASGEWYDGGQNGRVTDIEVKP